MTQKPRFEEDIVANQINFPINVHYVDGKRKFIEANSATKKALI